MSLDIAVTDCVARFQLLARSVQRRSLYCEPSIGRPHDGLTSRFSCSSALAEGPAGRVTGIGVDNSGVRIQAPLSSGGDPMRGGGLDPKSLRWGCIWAADCGRDPGLCLASCSVCRYSSWGVLLGGLRQAVALRGRMLGSCWHLVRPLVSAQVWHEIQTKRQPHCSSVAFSVDTARCPCV